MVYTTCLGRRCTLCKFSTCYPQLEVNFTFNNFADFIVDHGIMTSGQSGQLRPNVTVLIYGLAEKDLAGITHFIYTCMIKKQQTLN